MTARLSDTLTRAWPPTSQHLRYCYSEREAWGRVVVVFAGFVALVVLAVWP